MTRARARKYVCGGVGGGGGGGGGISPEVERCGEVDGGTAGPRTKCPVDPILGGPRLHFSVAAIRSGATPSRP